MALAAAPLLTLFSLIRFSSQYIYRQQKTV